MHIQRDCSDNKERSN